MLRAGAVHRDPAESLRTNLDGYLVALMSPGAGFHHPRVEAGLVEVDDGLIAGFQPV